MVLVCYTDQPARPRALPRRELVDELLAVFDASPVTVVDAFLVSRGRWWSYTCRGACCPPSGTPVPDGRSDAPAHAAAEAALRGRVTFGSRAELAASVSGPAPPQLPAVGKAFAAAAEALCEERRRNGEAGARRRTVELVQKAATRSRRPSVPEGELSHHDVARICLGLADRLARDQVAALAAAAPGAWLPLLAELARRTPDDAAAPICTTLAWVAYQDGDGATANVALDRALTAEPDCQMALLLRESLNQQIPPDVIRTVSLTAEELADPSPTGC